MTVTGNQAVSEGTDAVSIGGGLFFPAGLKNSIVALNTADIAPDIYACGEASEGHNIIGDVTESGLALQASDLIGNPGLGAYTDSGAPGAGHLPALAGSQAIDSADPAACTPQDQLGQGRVNTCERGAVEFLAAAPPAGTPTPVPALNAWGAGTTMLILALSAVWGILRRRRVSK